MIHYSILVKCWTFCSSPEWVYWSIQIYGTKATTGVNYHPTVRDQGAYTMYMLLVYLIPSNMEDRMHYCVQQSMHNMVSGICHFMDQTLCFCIDVYHILHSLATCQFFQFMSRSTLQLLWRCHNWNFFSATSVIKCPLHVCNKCLLKRMPASWRWS